MRPQKQLIEQIRVTMVNEATGEQRIMQEAFLSWKSVIDYCKKTEQKQNEYNKWIILKIEKLMGNGMPYL